MVNLLEKGPFSTIARYFANRLVSVCSRCHQSPINEVFVEGRGEKSSSCLWCQPDRLVAKLFIKQVLGLDELKYRRFAASPLYVRSVIAWLGGVSRFGVSKPQPTMPPIAIVWNYTYKCNLKCKHCYQDSTSSLEVDNHLKELSTSEALQVVDLIAKSGCGSLSFSGGEPLIREDFFEVAKRTSNRGLLCTLSTNGTMIDHTIV